MTTSTVVKNGQTTTRQNTEAESLKISESQLSLKDADEAQFLEDIAAIDSEFNPRMYEDLWMVASGQITYTDLKADYKAATGKDVLPIDAWVAKKQAKREPST